MASYSVFLKPSVVKELEGIPRKDRLRIVKKIQFLAADQRPIGCEKLTAQEQYRLRQGRYRIVYSVSDSDQTVRIVKIAHRKDVYR
ncbi:MAG: addiction module antitoxin [Acidobacteria bacterium RIFCSPLOWO2_12_FULL_54_10]|nr:MAG: addiction module antitoxin [Acidobacteria bacterium RIFCSPLOWO2_12_FULL_54_10]